MQTYSIRQEPLAQRAECEAAVNALSSTFSEEDSDAILLVDADNAFNRKTGKAVLHTIRIICPINATYICHKII